VASARNYRVCIRGKHPVYLPISAIGGGPPFHPNCVHVLAPFVERLAAEDKKKQSIVSPEVLNRTPAQLQRRYRQGAVKRTGRR
jgi:hypothetical protein